MDQVESPKYTPSHDTASQIAAAFLGVTFDQFLVTPSSDSTTCIPSYCHGWRTPGRTEKAPFAL